MAVFLKSFEEMTLADYQELGLKAGLEIHQQLLTDKKLFCHCPAGRYSRTYDAEILRHMRPTLSELGEYDGTALMEFKTKKEIIYRINHESVCTYEMDDTPPFEINQKALDIALEIASLLNYKLVDEIHIARKQYLDGSIPTGFQRTTIVGIDGWVPYQDRRIGLIQLGLEEDACREISDIGHQRVYITDRLGMPLIEMVTQPELRTPQEVADVANLLRWAVRSTGKVRTGIGAARQDVNVSITGGTRIEIKGVPRTPLIPLLVYNEAIRQYSLLQIRAELKRRDIVPETFRAVSADVTRYLTKTSWDPIYQALKRGELVYCVNLLGFRGILSYPTQTGKMFAREISDRVRVVACLTRLPNILTSESTEETIDSLAGKRIRNAVNAKAEDALILVWGNAKDVQTGVQEIIIRAREATIGIPSETRQALADGTNGFERILPGPERMYPDTDLPPLAITPERMHQIQTLLPTPLWERIEKYRQLQIPEHLIVSIASSPQASFFDELVQPSTLPARLIAILMFEKIHHWRRQRLDTARLTREVWRSLFQALEKYPPLEEAGSQLLETYLQNPEISFQTLLTEFISLQVTPDQIQPDIDRLMRENPPVTTKSDARQRYWMGKLMSRYRGRVSGREMRKLLARRMSHPQSPSMGANHE